MARTPARFLRRIFCWTRLRLSSLYTFARHTALSLIEITRRRLTRLLILLFIFHLAIIAVDVDAGIGLVFVEGPWSELLVMRWINAFELALSDILVMDADGCRCWNGLGIFAVDVETVVRSMPSTLELSLLMSNAILFDQFGASLVCAFVQGHLCNFPASAFD